MANPIVEPYLRFSLFLFLIFILFLSLCDEDNSVTEITPRDAITRDL